MKILFKYTGPTEFYAESWREAEEILLSGMDEDEREYSDEEIKEAANNAKGDRKLDDWKEREKEK